MTQGKGSRRRPTAVPRATADANYERTFGVQDRYAPPGVRYIRFGDIPEFPSGGFAYECLPTSDRADANG